jgi:hypothetical protein
MIVVTIKEWFSLFLAIVRHLLKIESRVIHPIPEHFSLRDLKRDDLCSNHFLFEAFSENLPIPGQPFEILARSPNPHLKNDHFVFVDDPLMNPETFYGLGVEGASAKSVNEFTLNASEFLPLDTLALVISER